MGNKTCGECRYYFEQADFCRKNAWECIEEDKECCEDFEPPTNGDVIRQGGNIELFIYWQKNRCSVCAFDGKDTCSRASCYDGMMEWLNAPAESEVEDEEKTV